MDLHSFRLAEKSSCFNEQKAKHVAEWSYRLQVDFKSKLFDHMDPMLTIEFSILKMVCDNNRVHEEAEMGLVPFFIKKGSCSSYKTHLSEIQIVE